MRTTILSMLLLLTFLGSCGEDVGSNRPKIRLQEESTIQLPQHFETRINNKFLVAGVRCVGGETTIDIDRETVTCERNQFLITLDNVNTCDSNGCTEAFVDPIIAELFLLDDESTQFDFFEIIPISTISDIQRTLIDGIRIRSDATGAQVVTSFP